MCIADKKCLSLSKQLSICTANLNSYTKVLLIFSFNFVLFLLICFINILSKGNCTVQIIVCCYSMLLYIKDIDIQLAAFTE